MTKIRTYKSFTLTYNLETEGDAYIISVSKDSKDGFENCNYKVNGEEKELKALLCRMWSCSVTPMSLRYILQDEGYLPQTVEEHQPLKKAMYSLPRRLLNRGDDNELVVTGGKNN